jgi:pilus assembly protein FimV
MADDGMTRMAIAGIAMLFLVVLWLLVRRRRSLRNLEDSILSGSAFDGPASLLSGLMTKKKPRYMSEQTMAGMGRIEANEVDPLAEAEVYLAYGRVDQAEQVLKEALARDPERHELTVKLLEIYQQADDVRSFDALVSKLDLNEHEVNPVVWSNVVALRLKMHKDSPLQPDKTPGAGNAEESTPPSPEPLDWELPFEGVADQGSSLQEKAGAGMPDDVGSLESDLNPFPEPDRSVSVAKEELGMLSSATHDPSDLEFEIDLDTLVDDHGQNLEAGLVSGTGVQDTGAGDEDDQSGRWNEVAIKVELAQAYLNMGEKEEALNILKEVEHDGNPEQNSQIAELLRQANRG